MPLSKNSTQSLLSILALLILGALVVFIYPKISKAPNSGEVPEEHMACSEPRSSLPNNLDLKDWEASQGDCPRTPDQASAEPDQRIILTNRNDASQLILVPSVKALRIRTADQFKLDDLYRNEGGIGLIATPRTGSKIYFAIGYEGPAQIFSYDINADRIENIGLEEKNAAYIAPTGDRVVDVRGDGPSSIELTTLYFVCFNDPKNEQKILTLPKGQVFNKFWPEMDDTTELAWSQSADNKVEYSVFQSIAKDFGQENKFLNKSSATIPTCK
jgi:hypothetical protein